MLSWWRRDHLADMALAVLQSLIPDVAGNADKKVLFLGVFTLVLSCLPLFTVSLFPLFLSMSGFYLLPTLVLVSIHSLSLSHSTFCSQWCDLTLHKEACHSAELTLTLHKPQSSPMIQVLYSQEIVAQKTLKFGKLIRRRLFKWLNFNVDYSVPCFTLGTRGHYHN